MPVCSSCRTVTQAFHRHDSVPLGVISTRTSLLVTSIVQSAPEAAVTGALHPLPVQTSSC